jgi:hypothetical protein
MGNTTRRLDSIVYRHCFAGSLHHWEAAASFARESVNIPQIVNLPDISFPFPHFEAISCNYLIASYFLFQKPPILGRAPGKLRRARQQASLLAVRTLTQALEKGANAPNGEV